MKLQQWASTHSGFATILLASLVYSWKKLVPPHSMLAILWQSFCVCVFPNHTGHRKGWKSKILSRWTCAISPSFKKQCRTLSHLLWELKNMDIGQPHEFATICGWFQMQRLWSRKCPWLIPWEELADKENHMCFLYTNVLHLWELPIPIWPFCLFRA